MNLEQFIEGLSGLDDRVWQELTTERALLLVDDARFEAGPAKQPNAVVLADTDGDLREHCLANAEQLYQAYYRTHPLTRTGFERQAAALFEHYGPQCFVAPEGQIAERTLFVDGGEVIAPSRENPVHSYGACLEVPARALPRSAADEAWQWLRSGKAYETYLSMNVCRYNCGS